MFFIKHIVCLLFFLIQVTCAPGRLQLTWPRVATVTATWDAASGALTLTPTPLAVPPWPACVSAPVLATLVDRMVPWAAVAAACATRSELPAAVRALDRYLGRVGDVCDEMVALGKTHHWVWSQRKPNKQP